MSSDVVVVFFDCVWIYIFAGKRVSVRIPLQWTYQGGQFQVSPWGRGWNWSFAALVCAFQSACERVQVYETMCVGGWVSPRAIVPVLVHQTAWEVCVHVLCNILLISNIARLNLNSKLNFLGRYVSLVHNAPASWPTRSSILKSRCISIDIFGVTPCIVSICHVQAR